MRHLPLIRRLHDVCLTLFQLGLSGATARPLCATAAAEEEEEQEEEETTEEEKMEEEEEEARIARMSFRGAERGEQ